MIEAWRETVLRDMREKREAAASLVRRFDAAIEAIEALDGDGPTPAPPAPRSHKKQGVRPTEGKCERSDCGKAFAIKGAGKPKRFCGPVCARLAAKVAAGAKAAPRPARSSAPRKNFVLEPKETPENGWVQGYVPEPLRPPLTYQAPEPARPAPTAEPMTPRRKNMRERLDAILRGDQDEIPESSMGMKARVARERAQAASGTRRA